MVEKDDLGLTLSLSFPQNPSTPLRLNLLPPSAYSSSPAASDLHKPSWNEPLSFSGIYSFFYSILSKIPPPAWFMPSDMLYFTIFYYFLLPSTFQLGSFPRNKRTHAE